MISRRSLMFGIGASSTPDFGNKNPYDLTRSATTDARINPSVDTVDDLRAVGIEHKLVHVNGYHTPGDGGGGTFISIADGNYVDDGGMTIVASGGVWKRITNGIINVRWFGAKGDSTTDDSLALQNAIDYCIANEHSLFIPAGSFVVSRSLNLTFDGQGPSSKNFYRGMHIFGVGRNNTSVIVGNCQNRPVFDMTGARLCRIEDIQVVHMNDDTTKPSCAFFLCRNRSNGGAGSHVFSRVGTYGYFTKASFVSVSSEVNAFSGCSFITLSADSYAFHISSQNRLGIESDYIPGLDSFTFSGGNTRLSFTDTYFSKYGKVKGDGVALFVHGDDTSPTVGLVFSACYSITEPANNNASIIVDGTIRDMTLIGHRDESKTAHCFVINSGANAKALSILGGEFAKNFFGEEASTVTQSLIQPYRVGTSIDLATARHFSIDFFNLTFSNLLSIGGNGLRIRSAATGTRVMGARLLNTDLVLSGPDASLTGFSATLQDVQGYAYDYQYGTKSREFKNKVNTKGLVLYNQDIKDTISITPDLSAGSHITIRLTADVTINSVIGQQNKTLDTRGSLFVMTIIQDSIGGHAIEWHRDFDLRGGSISASPHSITSWIFAHVDPTGTGKHRFVRIGT